MLYRVAVRRWVRGQPRTTPYNKQGLIMDKLIEIAMEHGSRIHYPDGSKPDRYFFKADELHAYTENVCAPLIEALKNAPIVSMFDDAEKFVSEYERWRDAVKIPVVIKHERTIMGDKK